ncbi:hypothetical protein [Hyphomicrobium sp.]|uniref:hypothetical protein n=1 Tax=Hyphomicrobium sp. TaxID=82 RepID=UPI003F6ED100
MRYATVLAASAAATLIMAVAPTTSALADRDDRGRSYKYSYGSKDRADARRAYSERKWRRAYYSRKHGRHYAYPWGPWGPFAFPPGL